jgi:DNA-binding response OmpR family regulator
MNSPSTGSDGHPFQGARILVVDDEPYNVELLLFELEDRGFKVLSAHDGQAGLEVLQRETVDIALVDVMMPRMDGFEMTRRLRRIESSAELPVILLTAKGSMDDKREGFLAEANDYVVKPFNIENVLARVHVQLGIQDFQRKRRGWAEANSRIAMVGAAAHELAQPLSGAYGYLQLLSGIHEMGMLDDDGMRQRLHQVNDCLVRTRELAGKIQRLVHLVLEDYACGMKIVDIHKSVLASEKPYPEPDDPKARVLRIAKSGPDPNLPRELAEHEIELDDVCAEEDLQALDPDMILLSVPDQAQIAGELIDTIRKGWTSISQPLPPMLALLPPDLMGAGSPGVELLKLGVADVLSRPFHKEELLLRMRSLIRLHRLRRQDLRARSLAAAQEVRQQSLKGFMPVLEDLIEIIRPLLLDPEGYSAAEARLFEGLDQLTQVVRGLQARELNTLRRDPALGGEGT